MAVMGVQLVVSLFVASVMQKMAPHWSFARWLLCNGSLRRYKHPSEDELLALAGKQKARSKRERRINGVTDDKPSTVPRDIDLRLESCPVTAVDALVLCYFLEYQWYVDFGVYATLVYLFTEAYYCLLDPQAEVNIRDIVVPFDRDLLRVSFLSGALHGLLAVCGFRGWIPVFVPRGKAVREGEPGQRLPHPPHICSPWFWWPQGGAPDTWATRMVDLGVKLALGSVDSHSKIFSMVMRHYFRSPEGGERSVCLTFALFFLLVAMLVLVVPEKYLEFGLDAGLANVYGNLELFLKEEGWEWTIPVSKLTLKLALVGFCSFIGACLTFPGLRLAQTHLDALKMAADRPAVQLRKYHPSWGKPGGGLPLPVIVILLWVKPIARDLALNAPMGRETVQIMSDAAFNSARLWTIALLCLLRLVVARYHLQAYLNLAERWVEQMKREAGRITVLEIQRKVTRIFCYLTVVSLQYLAPILLTFHCTLLLKTLGEYSWGFYPEPALTPAAPRADRTPQRAEGDEVQAAVQQITGTLNALRSLFTPLFFRGFLSFFTWWVSACQTVAALFGLYFHQHLAAS
ncbi:hypothetical protein JRQ81_008800 [Phrynocephalus forsythii]|uniref:Transmembrane protein 161A n=1 Tax=Phrynocephalus forsythii TaxID=171643 RepID=A0A9Q1ASM8_9SAUR|nr:hypothetical protein JRQ81_008800 [Phrynocephalus forsythii]